MASIFSHISSSSLRAVSMNTATHLREKIWKIFLSNSQLLIRNVYIQAVFRGEGTLLAQLPFALFAEVASKLGLRDLARVSSLSRAFSAAITNQMDIPGVLPNRVLIANLVAKDWKVFTLCDVRAKEDLHLQQLAIGSHNKTYILSPLPLPIVSNIHIPNQKLGV